MRLLRQRDWQRTCEQCGETWTVPSGLRHQRHSRTRVGLSPFERLRLRLGSQDGPRPGYSPTATRREVDAYLNELAIDLARCPACGSATWAEHRG